MKRLILLSIALLLGVLASANAKAGGDKPALIPYPAIVEWKEGSFEVRKNTKIHISDPSLEAEAKFVQSVIEQETGIKPAIATKAGRNSISIHLLPENDEGDGYTLWVDKKSVSITALTRRSVLLAAQTLRQLIGGDNGRYKVAGVSIYDRPEWEWRGMHLDVSRHFFDKEEVMRYLDLMARYKFNKFHWHLTDDQGWRIEIKKYPALTGKSAWRQFNNHDRSVLNTAKKEHNTDMLLPEDKLRETNGVTEYGGYYTQDEIREVVSYAASLGIDVMPEIDMPGHMSGAIAVYPELSCFNTTGWGETFSSPLCPGKDHTLEFCKDIFREVFELFPYVYIHLGADEVEKTNWKKCPHCQARIKDKGLADEKELQSWFVHEMEDFFTQNGKVMVGWDEITEGGISKTAVMMWWRPWARNALPIALANGNEVILTPNNTNYFDFKQHPNTLRDLYEANPIPSYVNPEYTGLIKGVQANVWCEYIPSMKRVEYMVHPRLFALSEITWRPNDQRNWDEFYGRMIDHFPVLDKLGVNYRPLDLQGVSNVNAFVGETEVVWNSPLKNIELRYTTDGSIPDRNSALYEKPFRIDRTTDFTIRMFRPDGSAADIIKASYRKEQYRPGVKPASTTPGLKAAWHEGIFNRVDKIETEPVKQEYIVESIMVPRGVGGKRGMVYTGYIEVPRDGIYTFSLGSDDGSALFIHNELVIDNDGPHGPVTVDGQIALGKGLHPVKLYYFDMNNGGFVSLKMFAPDGKEIELNKTNLKH